MPTKPKYSNIKELASYIAKKEAKLSQVKIGDIREVLSILSDLEYAAIGFKGTATEESPSLFLFKNGRKRFNRKKK